MRDRVNSPVAHNTASEMPREGHGANEDTINDIRLGQASRILDSDIRANFPKGRKEP